MRIPAPIKVLECDKHAPVPQFSSDARQRHLPFPVQNSAPHKLKRCTTQYRIGLQLTSLRNIIAVLLLTLLSSNASAGWVTRDQHWVSPRGSWNWSMSKNLPQLYRELNGIAFGHAHLAETLLKTQDLSEVEKGRLEILDFIFSSPSVPPDEEQIAPTLIRLVWEAQKTFNWAHTLHTNLYDLFAADNVQDKEAGYREILSTYLSKSEAITPHPLDHMGKLSSFPESHAFKSKFPKFTTQIWAYHWLQAGTYDVQLAGDSSKQRELLKPVIAHYHGYLRNPPVEWQFMPMMHEAAPEFSKRFPEAAAIFDNLHMLHDNIDDILSRPDLYPTMDDKRSAILKILPIFLHKNHSPQDQYAAYDQKQMMKMPSGSRPPSAREVFEGKASAKIPARDHKAHLKEQKRKHHE